MRLPETFKTWKRGSCIAAAIFLHHSMRESDAIVEGYISFASGKGQTHTWLEISGKRVDPTFSQFRRFKGYPKASYREVRRRSPEKFNNIIANQSLFWEHEIQQFL